MLLNGNIYRGDILECDYGNYTPKKDANGKPLRDTYGNEVWDDTHFDSPIPYEMVKRRPVLVLGDHKGLWLVVPISSTLDTHNNPRKSGVGRRLHIPVPAAEMPDTHRYGVSKDRWAKANLIQAVDKKRLSTAFCNQKKQLVSARVSPDTLRKVQEAVIRSIGLGNLVDPPPTPAAQPVIPQ